MVLLIAAIAAPVSFLWASGVAVSAGSTVLESETMTVAADSDTRISNDANASGGRALWFWGNDTVTGAVTTSSTTTTLTPARPRRPLQRRPERDRQGRWRNGPDGRRVDSHVRRLQRDREHPRWAPQRDDHVLERHEDEVRADRNLRSDKLTFVGGTGDNTAPGAPSGLTATPGDKTAALAWNANTESDLAGYNVYRSTTTGGPYTKDNTALVTTPSYNDAGLTNGTKYYWVVQAVDTSTNTSGNSNEASTTPVAAQDGTPGRADGAHRHAG